LSAFCVSGVGTRKAIAEARTRNAGEAKGGRRYPTKMTRK